MTQKRTHKGKSEGPQIAFWSPWRTPQQLYTQLSGVWTSLQLKEQALIQSSFHSLLLVTAITPSGSAQKQTWM